MKHVLVYLFAAALPSLLTATPLTVATCQATARETGILFFQSSSSSCSATAESPGFPGVRAYSVQVLLNSGSLLGAGALTAAQGGPWQSLSDAVTASAVASIIDSDLITFPGSGVATLRLDVNTRQYQPDGHGAVTFTIDGAAKVVGQSSLIGKITTLDFTIPLGSPFLFRTDVFVSSLAGLNFRESSDFRFSVDMLRLYAADGSQMNSSGTGSSGRLYDSAFSMEDTSQGPVLAAAIPEPSTFGLMLIAALAYCIGGRRGRLKVLTAVPARG